MNVTSKRYKQTYGQHSVSTSYTDSRHARLRTYTLVSSGIDYHLQAFAYSIPYSRRQSSERYVYIGRKQMFVATYSCLESSVKRLRYSTPQKYAPCSQRPHRTV